MNQNEIITAVVALMVCGVLAGATAIPLIAGISQETINEEYNDESNAGWLRMAYDNKPFDVEITADGDNITAGGQTGLNDDMILYADASACAMSVNGAFVIVNGYAATPEVINATSVAITNAGGSLTVEADGNTVITANSPAWAYYPDATGKYAYFGADVDGVKIKGENNQAYAGNFAGAYAYNNMVVARGAGTIDTLSLNAIVEDDVITSVTWAVQEVADTLGAIDFDPSTITLQPLDPSIIDDPITSGGVGLMSADPTSGTRVGDLYYTFSGSNATLIGYASTADWSQVTSLPDTVEYNGTTYTVTNITQKAFENCTNLALTSLPAGVTYIGNYAFQGCTNLALTSLPAGITSISLYAFQGCTNLALTSLPDNLRTINAYAFWNCTNLAISKIPDKVTQINAQAFRDCRTLENIVLPESLNTIGDEVFLSCTNLESVIIQSSPSIGSGVFSYAGVKDVLNLGDTEITTTSYGLHAEEVRDDIPASGYIAPLSTTAVVTKEGAVYDLISLLPLIMVLGIVMMGVYAVGTRYA